MSAAQYINRQLAVLPVLRPLVLAVKAYLREIGLNEASALAKQHCLCALSLRRVSRLSVLKEADVFF